LGKGLGDQVRRPKVIRHVDEIDEHLDLLKLQVVGRHDQRVVQVVPMQKLVVVGGAGELCPRLG